MAKYRNIVVLTGAGISAESGLGTFRGAGGLWAEHRIEDVATPEAFARDPDLVQRFYSLRRAELAKARPNAAHTALAELEAGLEGSVTIVTQNVDDLHEQAGSRSVLHMHGELTKVRCLACGHVASGWTGALTQSDACPRCGASPALRPHIVWFGEMPFHMDEIDAALYDADLFVSIGTSGNVYPAAGFIAQVRSLGRAHTVELNLEPSEGGSLFAEARYGPATQLIPTFVAEVLGR